MEQRVAERHRAKRATVWRDREENLREAQYRVSLKALDKAEQMLEFPLATVERVDNDGHTWIVKAPAWNFGSVPQLLEAWIQEAQCAIGNEGSILAR